MKRPDKTRIVIAGSGLSHHHLARLFLSKGYSVTVINDNRQECEQLAEQLEAVVVHGDPTDPAILHDVELSRARVLLAMTRNDPDNLAIGLLARREFRVPRILALVNDPANARLFEKMGLHSLTFTDAVASLIEQRARLDTITNLAPVADGKVNIAEIVVQEDTPAAWQTLKTLNLPHGTLIITILRDDETIIPHGETQMWPGDRLIVAALPANQAQALEAIAGEGNV